MYDLNKVIKSFKFLEKNHIIEDSANEYLTKSYYAHIIEALIFENKFPKLCKHHEKVMHHHFMYWLPINEDMSNEDMDKFFSYLRNNNHPSRYIIETFFWIDELAELREVTIEKFVSNRVNDLIQYIEKEGSVEIEDCDHIEAISKKLELRSYGKTVTKQQVQGYKFFLKE